MPLSQSVTRFCKKNLESPHLWCKIRLSNRAYVIESAACLLTHQYTTFAGKPKNAPDSPALCLNISPQRRFSSKMAPNSTLFCTFQRMSEASSGAKPRPGSSNPALGFHGTTSALYPSFCSFNFIEFASIRLLNGPMQT